jgi:hypothetical protein
VRPHSSPFRTSSQHQELGYTMKFLCSVPGNVECLHVTRVALCTACRREKRVGCWWNYVQPWMTSTSDIAKESETKESYCGYILLSLHSYVPKTYYLYNLFLFIREEWPSSLQMYPKHVIVIRKGYLNKSSIYHVVTVSHNRRRVRLTKRDEKFVSGLRGWNLAPTAISYCKFT